MLACPAGLNLMGYTPSRNQVPQIPPTRPSHMRRWVGGIAWSVL